MNSSSIGIRPEVVKHPHTKCHRRSLSGNSILTNWVGLPCFGVPRFDLISACVDETALNMFRSPNPEQDTEEVEREDITPSDYPSVKVEFKEIKPEEDDAQHASGSGIRSSFYLGHPSLHFARDRLLSKRLQDTSPRTPSPMFSICFVDLNPQSRNPRGWNDHLSVQAEFPKFRAEEDGAEHNITRGLRSRTSSALDIHLYVWSVLVTEGASTGYQPSQTFIQFNWLRR